MPVSAADDPEAIEQFILALGQAQLAAGYPVDDVTSTLDQVSRAYGRGDLSLFVLPNAVMVDDPVVGRARVISEGPAALRLDQAAQVHQVAQAARRGAISPEEGVRRLAEIRAKKPRYPAWASVLGYALAASGFALVFRVSVWGVGMAFVGGLFVGTLLMITRNRPNIAPLVPPLAAFVCAFAIFGFASLIDSSVQPLRVVAAPIIALIPGVALTRGTQELASGHIISGASRLVAAIVQILVLTFGILIGALLAKVSPYDLGDLTEQRLPLWVAWIGAAIYAIGQALAFNEPKGAVRYVVLLLLVAFSIQQLVAWQLDSVLAAGVAAAVALFLALLIQDRILTGPPAFVLFAPVFWLLVPGSLGLVGLAEALTGTSDTATSNATTAVGTTGSLTSSLDSLTVGSDSSVVLLAGASIIAITIGMQIASVAGRLIKPKGSSFSPLDGASPR